MKEPVARSDLRLALGGAYYGTLRKLLWLKERSSFARERCEAILPYSAASHKTPLMRRLRDVDMWMQENKVTNLRLASARVNGIVLRPGQTFSYWYLIGRPTARKGYLPGMLLRYGDDGEPQGTAGQPMLNVLQREGVENVVCVVTRYFGGVLLGAGGLTRAYARSAKDALDAAGKARMRLWSAVTVDCPYPLLERLKLLAAAHGGTVEGTDFGAAVSVRILLPQENAAGFDAALTELSAGTMTARREDERFLPGPRE